MSENAEPIGGIGMPSGIGMTEGAMPYRQSVVGGQSFVLPDDKTAQRDPSSQEAASPARVGDSVQLSPEARQQLQELKARDAEVRAHERAHMAAAGEHAVGGPQYSYQTGPDGRQYAIGGQVNIDTSAVPGDPEASEEKARQVRRAALAPGQPSAQDMQVAAEASQLEAQSRMESRQDDGGQDGGQGGDGTAVMAPDAMREQAAEPAVSGLAAGANVAVIAGAPVATPGEAAAGQAQGPDAGDAGPARRRQVMQAYETASLGSPARGERPHAAAPSGEGWSLRATVDGIIAAYGGSGASTARRQTEAFSDSAWSGISMSRALRAYAADGPGGAFAAAPEAGEPLVAYVV